MQRVSNQTKAVLYPENMLSHQWLCRADCIVVQSYAFDLMHNRNAYGESYDNGEGGTMTMTLRVGTRANLRFVYERLSHTVSSPFSVMFNVSYDQQGYVKDYESAFMAEAYVVDVEECFDRDAANQEGKQMSLILTLLLASLTYVGMNAHLTHDFSN